MNFVDTYHILVEVKSGVAMVLEMISTHLVLMGQVSGQVGAFKKPNLFNNYYMYAYAYSHTYLYYDSVLKPKFHCKKVAAVQLS